MGQILFFRLVILKPHSSQRHKWPHGMITTLAALSIHTLHNFSSSQGTGWLISSDFCSNQLIRAIIQIPEVEDPKRFSKQWINRSHKYVQVSIIGFVIMQLTESEISTSIGMIWSPRSSHVKESGDPVLTVSEGSAVNIYNKKFYIQLRTENHETNWNNWRKTITW